MSLPCSEAVVTSIWQACRWFLDLRREIPSRQGKTGSLSWRVSSIKQSCAGTNGCFLWPCWGEQNGATSQHVDLADAASLQGISQLPFIHPQCKHSPLYSQSCRNSGGSKQWKTASTFDSKITSWSVLYLLIHTAFLGSLRLILRYKKQKKHPFLLGLNNISILCFILSK